MSFNNGFWLPYGGPYFFNIGTTVTLDATGEICAFIGRLCLQGQATSKTIDTSGSSAFYFSVGANPVFDNASSVFTVGIQGVDNTTGLPVRPNGTWAARSVITTAAPCTPTLTTTGDYHVAVPTTGSSSVSHGDLVAIVLEMTTRAGTDSVVVQTSAGGQQRDTTQFPSAVTNISGSWANVGAGAAPSVMFACSDGTLGWIDGSWFAGIGTTAQVMTWADASNPDEYGMIFQAPFQCQVDAIYFQMRPADATADMQFDLTSTPEGTPASLISGPITFAAENMSGAASDAMVVYPITPVTLSANTDYCVAVKATGAGNLRWLRRALPIAGARALLGPSGTTMRSVDRNAGSGAYGDSSTTLIYPIGVRVCDVTLAGGMRLAGAGGLAAG